MISHGDDLELDRSERVQLGRVGRESVDQVYKLYFALVETIVSNIFSRLSSLDTNARDELLFIQLLAVCTWFKVCLTSAFDQRGHILFLLL